MQQVPPSTHPPPYSFPPPPPAHPIPDILIICDLLLLCLYFLPNLALELHSLVLIPQSPQNHDIYKPKGHIDHGDVWAGGVWGVKGGGADFNVKLGISAPDSE